MYRNGLGTYTALACDAKDDALVSVIGEADGIGYLTDDWTPEKSAKRLADKVAGVGDYSGM